MTRPIKQIAETTEKMEKLDKAAACVVQTKDEIGELAPASISCMPACFPPLKSGGRKRKVSEAERSKIDFLRAAPMS